MSIVSTRAGAPAPITGPKWAGGLHDSLKLPSGAMVGATDNETLRREFIRLGILGAATDGRHVIVERYATMLQQIHDDAGNAAVVAWLAERK